MVASVCLALVLYGHPSYAGPTTRSGVTVAHCHDRPRLTSNGILLPFARARVEPKLAGCKGTYTGALVLEAAITTRGRAKDIRVLRSVGQCVDARGVEALKQWQFCPAEKNGQPIQTTMQFTVSIHYR